MEIFLSYPSERLPLAREVFGFLKSCNLNVWFDKDALVSGQDWDRERKNAQARASLTVLVCSPETISRQGVIQSEIKEILELIEKQPLGHIYLVPLRTEDIRLPPELAKYHYVDLFSDEWKIQLARSIRYRMDQLREDIPQLLIDYLKGNHSSELRQTFVVDEANELIDCRGQYFQYLLGGTYWDMINHEIGHEFFAGLYWAKGALVGLTEGSSLKNSWSGEVEEFFRSGELISLRLFYSWYGSGAAHHNHGTVTINGFGREFGTLELKRLFIGNEDALRFIMEYWKYDLRRQHSNIPELGLFEPPDGDDDKLWKFVGAYNFDAGGILINFDPYAVLPYAAGPQEVYIPWRELNAFLAHDVRDGALAPFLKELHPKKLLS